MVQLVIKVESQSARCLKSLKKKSTDNKLWIRFAYFSWFLNQIKERGDFGCFRVFKAVVSVQQNGMNANALSPLDVGANFITDMTGFMRGDPASS